MHGYTHARSDYLGSCMLSWFLQKLLVYHYAFWFFAKWNHKQDSYLTNVYRTGQLMTNSILQNVLFIYHLLITCFSFNKILPGLLSATQHLKNVRILCLCVVDIFSCQIEPFKENKWLWNVVGEFYAYANETLSARGRIFRFETDLFYWHRPFSKLDDVCNEPTLGSSYTTIRASEN